MAARLGEGRWFAFGALDAAGGLVAFTILRPEPDRWEVERTAVDAEHRRRGLATAVMPPPSWPPAPLAPGAGARAEPGSTPGRWP